MLCNLGQMNLFFDDTHLKENLYPFAECRNVADIRVGILSIREKWERLLSAANFDKSAFIKINAGIIPIKNSFISIANNGEPVLQDDLEQSRKLNFPWEIFQLNDWAIRKDFEWITAGRISQPIPASNTVISPENIFIEEGAIVTCSIINAAEGPVYIGKNATIMEGSLIRGPVAICEGAVLKMGAKVYAATTIGPYCIAGGEIKNSVLFGYSNKAHDGYLGDSVIAEFCNLGAGTSNSNIKNTASTVKLWLNALKVFEPVGLKAGLLMGDYSRAAINTSFNTGTVVGLCCNVFGNGFPPKFVPSFTWGDERYEFNKAIRDINNWMQLKNKKITQKEIEILKYLYKQST